MRTFVECRRISDDAQTHRAAWQEAGSAADALATAIQTGDTAKQAKESARLDAAQAALPGHVPTSRPVLSAIDRQLVAEATALVADPRWRSQPAKILRKLLPMFARYVVV